MNKAILCFLLVAAQGGCVGQSGDDRTLHLALKTSPNKLDPAMVVDVSEGEICAQLFEGLVRFAPDGSLAPAVASAWEIEDGGRRLVFHLDSKRRFSDGSRVTSRDVIASFDRVLSPTSSSSRQWVLTKIRGARAYARGASDSARGLRAPDDSTVTIELEAPFAPFLSMLALPAAMIVSTHSPAHPETGVPLGSGPWQLAAWERGDYLSLIPNPYHPGAADGLDEVRYRIIPEAFTRIAEFESGVLDILEVPPAELRRFMEDPRYEERLQSRAELRVYYIGLNNAQTRFADVRVRRALNMAVNVDQLIDVLADGQGVRARGSIPPGLAGYADRPGYPYDPAAARSLLAEAGYPDGFSIEIWQRESPEGNRVLEAIQGYLREVGVEVRLVRREWSAFKEAVSAGRVDAFFLDWFADYPDAENFLYPLFHSNNHGGGGNRSFFTNVEVDRLIDDASRAADPSVTTQIYTTVDSLVYDQAPWIYLYFPRTFVAVAERVEHYRLPALYLGADLTGIRKTP